MADSDTLKLIVTALSVSGPTFGWVLLGVVLRRVGVIQQRHVDAISRVAFMAALPVLLFASAALVDYRHLGDARYLAAGVVATFVTLFASLCYCRWRGFSLGDTGVFVQASYRSNLAIVGIALCHAAYGEAGLALATLPLAVMTALYNMLAVALLNATHGGQRSPRAMLLGMLRNPLLIGIGLGVAVSLLALPLPALVPQVSSAISRYFIPLTLVAIGGAIQLNTLHRLGRTTWEAAGWRLCVGPAIGVAVALLMGVRGQALGVIFLLLAAPVAAASFVMVVAARGNSVLAANIIILTTLLCGLTVTLGFSVLVALGLVGELVKPL
ncbi:AEC family transporter [Parahaliea aestuarii]|uniref:AEC family transporter n=1 Tax=Parahaliea aestuarii TaxID=1852021 RepID=A0A5C8ZR19_9GAMM|nr:AEC family transporter [Parahaliea aestuarii]TXS90908.1 AEC family transporter [Parahaliea aestuarii]